jgi:zinc-ribbon domain
VFCSKCGAQNADGAAFCYSCGNRLDAVSPSVPPSMPNQGAWIPARSVQGKNPVVAAILNLFFGLGYLYLGYSKVLGVPAIIFVVLVIVIDVITGLFTLGLLPLVLAILFAVDGWQKGAGRKGFINAQ